MLEPSELQRLVWRGGGVRCLRSESAVRGRTDGLTHSIKQALELLWEVCNYRDQRFEVPEILCMLLATLLITTPGLGTNQGLGRSLTLGLMHHVHLVRLNCLVKMLTAILPDTEPIDLLFTTDSAVFRFAARRIGSQLSTSTNRLRRSTQGP
jgi:hypothetical protein